jgi:hypothetical protein
MRAIAGGYSKAPKNDSEEYLSLTPTRNIHKPGGDLDPMDRFRRYEEVVFVSHIFFLKRLICVRNF